MGPAVSRYREGARSQITAEASLHQLSESPPPRLHAPVDRPCQRWAHAAVRLPVLWGGGRIPCTSRVPFALICAWERVDLYQAALPPPPPLLHQCWVRVGGGIKAE